MAEPVPLTDEQITEDLAVLDGWASSSRLSTSLRTANWTGGSTLMFPRYFGKAEKFASAQNGVDARLI